jgi:hypothetical protein
MKRLIIPLGILIVILAIWLVQSKMESKRISGKTIDNFLNLDAERINKIVLHTKNDTLTFYLQGGTWYAQDTVPRWADTLAINNMITTAVGLKVGNIISQNPDLQTSFQVDSTGNLAEFYDGDRLLSAVLVGKVSSDYSHTYVRKPGSDNVYLAEGLLTYVFNRQRIQWLDRTILSVAPDLIAAVEISYPQENIAYKIFRHDSLWFVAKSPYTDSILADSQKVASYIIQFQSLIASDFTKATDDGLIDFDSLSLVLNLSLVDGATRSVSFAKIVPEGSRVYCRKPDLEEPLVIYKSKYQNLAKRFADFLP